MTVNSRVRVTAENRTKAAFAKINADMMAMERATKTATASSRPTN